MKAADRGPALFALVEAASRPAAPAQMHVTLRAAAFLPSVFAFVV